MSELHLLEGNLDPQQGWVDPRGEVERVGGQIVKGCRRTIRTHD